VASSTSADVLYRTLLTLGDPDASDEHDFDLEHPRGEAHRALFSLLAGCTPALARDREADPDDLRRTSA
jgi:hypothetical protein